MRRLPIGSAPSSTAGRAERLWWATTALLGARRAAALWACGSARRRGRRMSFARYRGNGARPHSTRDGGVHASGLGCAMTDMFGVSLCQLTCAGVTGCGVRVVRCSGRAAVRGAAAGARLRLACVSVRFNLACRSVSSRALCRNSYSSLCGVCTNHDHETANETPDRAGCRCSRRGSGPILVHRDT